MKCKLCNQMLDTEHPENVYTMNPVSFRYAWMHGFCYHNEMELLESKPANKPELYLNRLDEYLEKLQQ